jgi:hypothetical protein
MTISEITAQISTLESQLKLAESDYNSDVSLTKKSFSFTDNWRDKQSIALRIPIKLKEVNKLKQEISTLQCEKQAIEKAIAEHNFLAIQKAKMEEEAKSRINNPISVLEIE